MVYLEEGEIARVNSGESLEIKTIANESKMPYIHELAMSLDIVTL